MNKYFQLIVFIIKYGSLRASEHSFNAERQRSLEKFNNDPSSIRSVQSTVKKGWIRSVIAQGAFIKSAFRNRGGHLSTDGLAYIRVPKAANTSLSYAMLATKFHQIKEQSINEADINFLADVNLKPATEGNTETFFTVVRDPFKRLVSVYRDFFESDHPYFIYQDYLFGILPKKISFAEFVDRVSKIPDRLRDQHLKPQHYFLKPYQKQQIFVTIFQLEEPEKLKAFLADYSLELTHRNKSGEAYDYAAYYTPEILNRAYSIYQTDVKFLGYAKAYEQLKSRL